MLFTTLDILQLKKSDDYESICRVNPLYLRVNHAKGYIEEKNGNAYLMCDDSVDENNGLLKKYTYVWNGTKNQNQRNVSECDYEKDFMKTKFNSDNDLPLKYR